MVGGGGCLLKNFFPIDPNKVILIDDICATAKGYEYLADLDDIDRQTRFLAEHKIETLEELLEDRSDKEQKLEVLLEQRTKLQNKIRRAVPEEKLNLRKEKAEVTAQITSLRKKIRDSKEIEQRSVEIQDTLDRAFEVEHPQRDSQNQMRDNR